MNGDDSVSSGNTEDYKAEDCILLEPGFDGANGSVVDLQIVPCDNQLKEDTNKQ